MADVTVMDANLKHLLGANGVPEEVVVWMTANKCCTIKQFFNFVDEAKEVAEHILAQLDPALDKDRGVVAALKQSWREAEATVQKGLKRASDGLEDSNLDEPLANFVQEELETTFNKYYNWELEAALRGVDSLLGRCKREADSFAPSMFSASKVRTAAQGVRASTSKKHKISDSMILEVEDFTNEYEDAATGSLRARLFQYEILATTWSIAGCKEVEYEGKKFLYCHWQSATKYVRNLRKRTEHLTVSFTEASVIEFLVCSEEYIRGYAMEATRSRSIRMPWGESLVTAYEKHQYIWQDNKNLLVPRSGGNHRDERDKYISLERSPGSSQAQQGKGKGGKGKGKKGGADIFKGDLNLCTVRKNARGHEICKMFNDGRGCSKSCPQGFLHGCDLRVASTKHACGLPHPRKAHDQLKHGKVIKRD